MRNFTLTFLFCAFLSAFSISSSAQCPNASGMVATPLSGGTNCFMYVQFALPNSNVSLYNGAGTFLGQGNADAAGRAVVLYPCASGPVTGVLSIVLATGVSCSVVNIANPATLPVKLTGFNGTITPQGALLKWATSYEFNNAKYVIEKSATGANGSYQPVGEVAASTSELASKNYSYTDASFKSGDAAFYRLKQVDIDGTSTYSKVVYVNSSKTGGVKLKVFPNPFVSEVQLVGISAADLNKNNVRLFNSTGAQVQFKISGSNAIQVDENAPSGVYILKVKDAAYKLIKN
jgi:hypothetical protein